MSPKYCTEKKCHLYATFNNGTKCVIHAKDKAKKGFNRRIPVKSSKREKEDREYMKLKKPFLETNRFCEVDVAKGEKKPRRSVDVHHKYGRSGSAYLDVNTWLSVSRDGHSWIENNPKEAVKLGLVASAEEKTLYYKS